MKTRNITPISCTSPPQALVA
ncbi:hypothetical protein R2601_02763 [Salipiger bermudensis HTCC2601]|uniref:Uncharacterized protein n=1 Tax=Salipiger bermudensis (strain DSM 26914 / JCM 13377 / KCTC 12554 / HTCC2601) TaxID=314265 RepID=Q0FWU3_SALBH|nr:hypothetical protein R2601_02763 [Salipiger bermudensis HTCC2601]